MDLWDTHCNAGAEVKDTVQDVTLYCKGFDKKD